MKAPDKIYLPKEEIEERMPWIAAPYEDDPNWDECYIRKDALLEWAESKHKDTDNMDVRTSMRMLIDKLNEM